MICKECGNDKSENEMFHYKVRGVSKPSSMCSECHSIASSRGGLKKSNNQTTGKAVVFSCVIPNNVSGSVEAFYITFGKNVSSILKSLKVYNPLPVALVGNIETTKTNYSHFIRSIISEKISGKWYFANHAVRSGLDKLSKNSYN